MNCEDVPMSEWDKLTGAEEEAMQTVSLSRKHRRLKDIDSAVRKTGQFLDAMYLGNILEIDGVEYLIIP